MSKADHPFKEWIGQPEAWKKKVDEVRNNYGVAHLQGYGDWEQEHPNFHSINEQLYTLVILCLLSECGVTEETKREIVERMRSETRIHL